MFTIGIEHMVTLAEEGCDPVQLQASAARHSSLYDLSQHQGDPLSAQPAIPPHEHLPCRAHHVQCQLQV